MKRNVYVELVHKRSNPIKNFIYNLFMPLAYITRMSIECFTRSSFGERYMSFSSCCIYAFFMGIIPIGRLIIGMMNSYVEISYLDFVLHYTTWYLYLYWYMRKNIEHRKEIKQYGSTFDYQRFSQSAGILDERLTKLKYNGQEIGSRTLKTIVEPGIFFIIGIILVLLAQRIGIVILFCSICYSISYFAAFKLGDDLVLDFIDNKIANEETANILINGAPDTATRGFNMDMRKPKDSSHQNDLAEYISNGNNNTFNAV